MNKPLIVTAAVVWVAMLALCGGGAGVAYWLTDEPAAPVERPSEPADKASVEPIRTILANATAQDKADLTAFYSDFADIVSEPGIETTGQIRSANQRTGRIMFEDKLKGKYPGLSQACSGVLEKALGLDDTKLDDAKRAAAVAALRSLAWACK